MKDVEVHQEGDTMAEARGLKWQGAYLTPGEEVWLGTPAQPASHSGAGLSPFIMALRIETHV